MSDSEPTQEGDAGSEISIVESLPPETVLPETSAPEMVTLETGAPEMLPAESEVLPRPAEVAPSLAEDEPSYWPEDWRETTAAAIAGGDEKAHAKELKRLKRYADPARIYGKARELEAKLSETGTVRLPGSKASAEEIAAYHRAIGVPAKAANYFDLISLDNGAVIGAADRPHVEKFVAALHPAGATPAVVSAALNWYYQNEEDKAAALDETDQAFALESQQTLTEEFGPAFARLSKSIVPLFADAPGGSDPDSQGSLFNRLMSGRLADGERIGNDPDVVRFFIGLARELYPVATVTEQGNQSGKTIDDEIEEIRQTMREDRRGYFNDDKLQARYRELIATRDRNGGR